MIIGKGIEGGGKIEYNQGIGGGPKSNFKVEGSVGQTLLPGVVGGGKLEVEKDQTVLSGSVATGAKGGLGIVGEIGLEIGIRLKFSH
ncbi:hypothetical protein [Flammeovirga pacifica]|uniref:Uncharacterized protein n=1 Tax=Flammeovirga pacifica TaxID=915059 RepID=A0A1S1YXQ8_FLAPC|nr:hypothetical protein [Flammeovirga pacifica]OHX65792.1 hypothetical protein NH26_05220 [Flammeovirga pacifica]